MCANAKSLEGAALGDSVERDSELIFEVSRKGSLPVVGTAWESDSHHAKYLLCWKLASEIYRQFKFNELKGLWTRPGPSPVFYMKRE